MGQIHLIKLCVGAESVEDLDRWQTDRRAASGGAPVMHVTRMWPRREAELLSGGSLYWVFRGVIRARQRLLAIEPCEGADGVTRHDLVLGQDLILTAPQPRRPFQGWRYLQPQDAPADLKAGSGAIEMPANLRAELREAMVW